MEIKKSFEIRRGNLEIKLPGSELMTVAVGTTTGAHVMQIAWPHLDDEERAFVKQLEDAGLPPAGITIRED